VTEEETVTKADDETDPASPLQAALEWADRQAGHTDRPANILRVQCGPPVVVSETVLVPARDPAVPGHAQHSVLRVTPDPASARASVHLECRRAEAALLRAKRLSQVLGQERQDLIEDLLTRVRAVLALDENADVGDPSP
jgi:hypothetical protein